eukprot:3934096-Rhodomonas_salina.1
MPSAASSWLSRMTASSEPPMPVCFRDDGPQPFGMFSTRARQKMATTSLPGGRAGMATGVALSRWIRSQSWYASTAPCQSRP